MTSEFAKAALVREMALNKAMVEFHNKVKALPMTGVNPRFNSKYSTLTDVIEGTRKVLAECGLFLTQRIVCSEDYDIEPDSSSRYWEVETTVHHVDGGFLVGNYPINLDSKDPQKTASAATYARRGGASMVLGLVGEEDDDGNAISPQRRRQEPRKPAKPTTKNIEYGQALAFFKQYGVGDRELRKALKISPTAKIRPEDIATLKGWSADLKSKKKSPPDIFGADPTPEPKRRSEIVKETGSHPAAQPSQPTPPNRGSDGEAGASLPF